MTRRIPNLETAIDYCRDNGLDYSWEHCSGSHIKFYVGVKVIVISSKRDNPDRVVRDIRRVVK